MAGSSTASEILGRIENDAVFSGFLEAGFDPASFASKIVRADVGRAAAAAAGGAATANTAAVGATPVLQLQQGGDGLGSSSNGGGGGAASAESVSSQAEITLDSMSSHIARIESAIRSHILDNEEDFLGSVGGVSELSRRTEEFRDGVRELRRSFARVQREVSEPHEAVRVRTQQLKNLHAATRLLKRALRFLSALRRLRGQEDVLGLEAAAAAAAASGGAAGGGGAGAAAAGGRSAGGAGGGAADLRELAKAAQSLQELESTLRDPEVAELEVVARERAYVEACGAAVRRMSADSLARGMKSLNQTDVGGALQVFFNLECLPARVKACVTHLAQEADEAVSEALQPEALADATSSSSSSATAATEAAAAAGGAGGAGADQQQQRSTSPTPGGIGGGGGAGGGGGVGRRSPATRDAGARRRTASMRAHAGKLAAALHGTSMEAWGLQRVLDKKRDPTTRALLDATVRADRSGGGQGGLSLRAGAYRAYWDGLCRAVRGSVERALEADGAVGGGSGGVALVAMYPFLRKAFLRLISRLEEGTAARQQQQQGSGAAGGGGDGLITAGGGSGAATAAIWSRPGAVGQQQRPAGGILGGSRWLALALDDDYDDLSLDPSAAGDEEQERQWDRRGAEAGAGPASGRRVLGLRGGKGTGGGGGEGRTGGDGGRDGGDSSDGARLLEALGPLRDLFLARSLERLTTPVEQMFPQFDGYMAAVPSKHDLASFVRSIHAELSLAVPAGSIGSTASSEAEAAAGGGGGGLGGGGGSLEADFSLLPILLKGVVQAARLFCTKVEAMQSVEEGAYTFGGGSNAALGGRAGGGTGDDDMIGSDMPGSAAAAAPMEAWAPTLEQEHNLQLLELVVKFREALLGIPALVLPSPSTPAASGAAAAAYGVECRERVAEAVRALDELASRVFLEPYLSGVARALEDIVSKMHRENFGPGVSAMATTATEHHGGGGGSLFLHELQRALAALQADHFTRIAALRTPCAEAALRSLAARVLRAYVTHCALIRPLSEGGKARVAQDMATLEIALSPLARVSELGAVYLESRAFRTLLFVDDAEDEDGDNNNNQGGGGGGGGGGRGRGRDSRSFLTEACMAHLRPTSVWHYLFSGAPDELSSPHVSRGMSQQAYVTWLLGGGAAEEAEVREKGNEAEAGGGGGGGGDRANGGKSYTERSTLSPDTSYLAEAGAWSVVQACLDEYHQRRSVAAPTGSGSADGGSAVGSTEVLPRAVGLLPEAGPALLSGYEARGSS